MKYLYFLLLFIPLLISACDQGGGMPNVESYSIQKIYSINLDNTGLKLIANGSNFSLLPDGKFIYINNNKICSCNSDGSDAMVISPPAFNIYDYQLCQNMTKIIFNQYVAPNRIVYEMNLDGSGLTKLTLPDTARLNSGFTFSHNLKMIAFTNREGLYFINADGSNLHLIKDTTNTFSFDNVSFTYDDSNIVYMQDIKGISAEDLRLYNIKTMHDTSMYYGTSGNWARGYSLSNFNTLLFSNASGVNLMHLNNYFYTFLHSGGDAHFSYDGKVATFTDLDLTIYVMHINSNNVDQIMINLPKNYISNPILSLDGQKVYFVADSTWSVIKKIASNDNIDY